MGCFNLFVLIGRTAKGDRRFPGKIIKIRKIDFSLKDDLGQGLRRVFGAGREFKVIILVDREVLFLVKF